MKNSKENLKLKELSIDSVLNMAGDTTKHRMRFCELDKETRLKMFDEVKKVSKHAADMVSEILEVGLGAEKISLIKKVEENLHKKNKASSNLFELKQKLSSRNEREADKQISETRLKMKIIEAENELANANIEFLESYAEAEENVFVNSSTINAITDILNQRLEVAEDIDEKIELLKTQISILTTLRKHYFSEVRDSIYETVKDKLCGIELSELINASSNKYPLIRSYISQENV